MTPSYATLDELRSAIRGRRIITFLHKGERFTMEPHVLCKGPRYGAFVLGGWIEELSEFHFYRYPMMRDVEITSRRFDQPRPCFDPYDRMIEQVDTVV
ncbi:WYL domain-containing protein [Luteolibacter sp. GHJ8]|uniref:WYL domain-containing protein n=1 Tax=Luteolibacter rhizosphaerae TaxID=2989719 RepID=A0ABT3G3E4_9BACT|nr:WYL domain-containing protein [Luteolibacter rhizosphaerae]MCW1913745.1 WYL domain-containing protein [Luteolibacter rhizosphaerae]